MTITRTARRARTALALAASAALLGLAACGTESPAPEENPDEPAQQQEGGEEEAPLEEEQDSPEDDGSDDGGSEESGSEESGSDEDQEPQDDQDPADAEDQDSSDDGGEQEGEDAAGPGAAGTRILLVTDLGPGNDSGAPTLTSDDVAALLSDRLGGEALCDGDLIVDTGAAVPCSGPGSLGSPEEPTDWLATAVTVPREEGLDHGVRPAVLFTTGDEFPAGAEEITQANYSLTGLGMGSMFGAEPLTAEELGERAVEVLTSENAYAPVADLFEGSEATCEDGLDFSAEYTAVPCHVTTGEGFGWSILVAPGTFADNDQGLLVGIGSPDDV